MRAFLLSFLFAATALAQQDIDLRYRFAIGEGSAPLAAGSVWLYHYVWGGLGSFKLADIENGQARIRLSKQRLEAEIRRPAHPGSYVIVLSLPGGLWRRTADLNAASLFTGFAAALNALGQSHSVPSGETVLVLPSLAKRRLTLQFEDGRPAAGREVLVSIYVSAENHCGVHQGLDLGAFRTDASGTIEVTAPLVDLNLNAPHYELEGGGPAGPAYWAASDLRIGSSPREVIRRAWELPRRDYALQVVKPDGSPAVGVSVSQTLRTRDCGARSGGVGQTDAAGVARFQLIAPATDALQLIAAGLPSQDLSEAELRELFSKGRLTVRFRSEAWPLRHGHDHVQGLDVNEKWFWISAVDRRTKTGWVWRVDRRTLQTVAERNITQGALYHAGGLQVVGDSLWVPIAEYRPQSSARILELDAMTLAERRSFAVPDHIGAVASDGKTAILGANWDARKIYRWALDGKLLGAVDFRERLAVQDMKWVQGLLYAGGALLATNNAACFVDQLDPASLAVVQRFAAWDGTCYTQEGMAVFGGRFFFLPGDGPDSRIYSREIR